MPVEGELQQGPFLGLDWFLLNLIVYSIVFIPLERLFARLPEQGIFRASWRTDLTYFFVSALLVQVTTILTLKPAMVLFDWASGAGRCRQRMRALPGVVQFALLMLVADFTQYWVHRAFHAVPLLWRFHAVHHSAEQMDWLAGSRLHLVDVAVTRGLTYVPIYVLGFADGPLFAYLVVVSAQATFIHANVRFTFGPLRWLVATPQFHHWHHAAEPRRSTRTSRCTCRCSMYCSARRILPDRWPSAYGISGGEPPPRGYLRQLLWPFTSTQMMSRRSPRRRGSSCLTPLSPRRRALPQAGRTRHGSRQRDRRRHRGRARSAAGRARTEDLARGGRGHRDRRSTA